MMNDSAAHVPRSGSTLERVRPDTPVQIGALTKFVLGLYTLARIGGGVLL
jgi:hypothetical protein